MRDELLDSLTSFVETRVANAELPINLFALLAEIGATFAVVERSDEASATGRSVPEATTLKTSSGYRVELMRRRGSPKYLTARERFSIAHEWAHIVIDQQLQWNPSSRREYYLREATCNRMAAHLLIPEHAQKGTSLRHPLDAIRSAARIRKLCAVSLPVSALRISEGVSNIVLAELKTCINKKDLAVLKVVWSSGATELFGVRQGKHLGPGHTWAELSKTLVSEGKKWVEVTIGQQRWALIRSTHTPGKFFAWAADNGHRNTQAPPAPANAFEQLSLLG